MVFFMVLAIGLNITSYCQMRCWTQVTLIFNKYTHPVNRFFSLLQQTTFKLPLGLIMFWRFWYIWWLLIGGGECLQVCWQSDIFKYSMVFAVLALDYYLLYQGLLCIRQKDNISNKTLFIFLPVLVAQQTDSFCLLISEALYWAQTTKNTTDRSNRDLGQSCVTETLN